MTIKLNYTETRTKYFAGDFERVREDVELIRKGKTR